VFSAMPTFTTYLPISGRKSVTKAWLFRNAEALEAVLERLEQARAGKLSKGLDLDAALAFVERIDDE